MFTRYRSQQANKAIRNRKWLPHLLPPRDQEEFVLQESGMTTASAPASATSPSNEDPNDPTTTIPSSPGTFSTQSAPLRRLLDETSDLIDSPTFTHINTLLLDTLFSHLTDTKLRSQAFKLPIEPHTHPSEPLPLDPATRVQEIFADPLTTPANTNDPNDPSLPQDLSQTTAKLATILAVMTRQAHAIGNGVPNEYVQALESVHELDAFAAVVYSSNFEFEAMGNGEGSSVGSPSGGQGVPLDPKTREVAVGGLVEGGGAEILGGEGEGGGTKGLTGGMFENVWGRVRGVGAEPITG